MGTLRINSQPWSQVYVNDALVGNTPQMSLQLPVGRHKVTLVNPEFGVRKTIDVKIDNGKTLTRIEVLAPPG